MEKCRVAGVVYTLLPVVAALCLSACRQPVGTPSDGPQASATPSGYGLEFLGPADCSSRGETFREVWCGSERAAARVLARHTGAPSDGPRCPPTTDFVLHISPSGPTPPQGPRESGRDGPAAAGNGPATPRGYACMRNLESPHPGDPGQGGGPLTVVGDCVHSFREGEVRETACDGSGEHPPEFEVGSAAARRALCPDTTDLYVRLGGDRPVGCARRV
ncbi:hypothetical protein [Streptomyces pratensis]|uniref:hypothetical protein n=1 Tax=Streptomyces pratensis TaxID=1169025 RepID=UPI0019325C71|nr:hypothetical protein [Streptomyces pratensis]